MTSTHHHWEHFSTRFQHGDPHCRVCSACLFAPVANAWKALQTKREHQQQQTNKKNCDIKFITNQSFLRTGDDWCERICEHQYELCVSQKLYINMCTIFFVWFMVRLSVARAVLAWRTTRKSFGPARRMRVPCFSRIDVRAWRRYPRNGR